MFEQIEVYKFQSCCKKLFTYLKNCWRCDCRFENSRGMRTRVGWKAREKMQTTLERPYTRALFSGSVGGALRWRAWREKGRRYCSRVRKSSSSVTTVWACNGQSGSIDVVSNVFDGWGYVLKKCREKRRGNDLSFIEKYEIIKEVKSKCLEESSFKIYRITDRLYKRVIDSKPEISEKVKRRNL